MAHLIESGYIVGYCVMLGISPDDVFSKLFIFPEALSAMPKVTSTNARERRKRTKTPKVHEISFVSLFARNDIDLGLRNLSMTT